MLFRSDLYKVQQTALNLADQQPGFAFFMEPGLGKTRTVLHEFHELYTEQKANCLAITCPSSLRGAWETEAKEIDYPYPVIIATDEKKALAEIKKVKGPFVIVSHFELVLTRWGRLLDELLDRGWDVYKAIDESTRIKNHKSKIGKRLYEIGKRCRYRRILTGTPAPQGTHDMWAQLKFLGEMERTPFYAFRHTYCLMGGYMGKQVVGSQNLDILQRRIGHYVFRAKKSDWADLPEKIWMKPLEIDMLPAQKQAYLEMLNNFVMQVGDTDQFVTVEMMISAKLKLQQIAAGWVYDEEKNIIDIIPPNKVPKIKAFVDLVNDMPTKTLGFYQYGPTMERVMEMLEHHKIKSMLFPSGMKPDEIEDKKTEFNNNNDYRVGICQTVAMKYGHTLIGNPTMRCSNSAFIENSYSLEARQQAEDRTHRHGQDEPCNYWDFATSKEDIGIIKALQKKEGLQEALLSEFTITDN